MYFFSIHTGIELMLTINRNIDCVAKFRFRVPGVKMNETSVASLVSSFNRRDVQIWVRVIQCQDFVGLQLLIVPVPGEDPVAVLMFYITQKLHCFPFEDISPFGLQLQERFGKIWNMYESKRSKRSGNFRYVSSFVKDDQLTRDLQSYWVTLLHVDSFVDPLGFAVILSTAGMIDSSYGVGTVGARNSCSIMEPLKVPFGGHVDRARKGDGLLAIHDVQFWISCQSGLWDGS